MPEEHPHGLAGGTELCRRRRAPRCSHRARLISNEARLDDECDLMRQAAGQLTDDVLWRHSIYDKAGDAMRSCITLLLHEHLYSFWREVYEVRGELSRSESQSEPCVLRRSRCTNVLTVLLENSEEFFTLCLPTLHNILEWKNSTRNRQVERLVVDSLMGSDKSEVQSFNNIRRLEAVGVGPLRHSAPPNIHASFGSRQSVLITP